MNGVLEVEINKDIVLDEARAKGMPDNIRGRLLTTMTIFCDKYDCHWTDLTWRVYPNGVISVKKKT